MSCVRVVRTRRAYVSCVRTKGGCNGDNGYNGCCSAYVSCVRTMRVVGNGRYYPSVLTGCANCCTVNKQNTTYLLLLFIISFYYFV